MANILNTGQNEIVGWEAFRCPFRSFIEKKIIKNEKFRITVRFALYVVAVAAGKYIILRQVKWCKPHFNKTNIGLVGHLYIL